MVGPLPTIGAKSWEASIEGERPRLIRLCTQLTGNPQVAEDLTQETLYEAWRNLHKVEEPEGFSKWLSAIARNVCLRWGRYSSQERFRVWSPADRAALTDVLESYPDEDRDVELDLERDELAELLDRALALLPEETRQVLIERYLEESPRAEIARRLGVSEAAVAMRIHRGKVALRKVLTREMRSELAPFGFTVPTDGAWEETPVWCVECGLRRFRGRFAEDRSGLFLRCPNCWRTSEFEMFQWEPTDLLITAKTYRPALMRMAAWTDRFYRSGLVNGEVQCPFCRGMHPLRRTVHPQVTAVTGERYGVHFTCPTSARWGSISLCTLVLFLPEGRWFWQDQRRFHTLTEREVVAEGRQALLTSLQSLTSPARLDIVSARDTYEVLAIHRTH